MGARDEMDGQSMKRSTLLASALGIGAGGIGMALLSRGEQAAEGDKFECELSDDTWRARLSP